MKIIHLSDTHMLSAQEQLFGVDPGKRLRACVAHINRHHGDAELCVITGDLANQGRVEAYAYLRELLRPLKPPVRLLLGNHDQRSGFASVFTDYPLDGCGFVQSHWPAEGLDLVFLDSKDENGGHQGRLCEDRLAWLESRLADGAEGRFVLFIHHPWFPLGIPSVDRINLHDSESLEQLLFEHRERILHLVFGHYHRFISGSWRGIPFHCINGVAHQIALEVHDPKLVAGSHEEPAYAVMQLGTAGVVVQQCHFLRDTYDFWIDH